MKMKIGDITEIIDGDRGKNYPKKSDFKDEGFCLFLNTGNVTSDGFVFKKNDFISEEKSNKLRKGKLERGDLVFTTRGTVGNVAYYSDNIPYDHVRINSGMVIFRVFEKKVFNKFLYQILKHKNSRIYIRQYCTGSAQPQLPIMNLRNIELNIPPLETQYKIARILLAYDDLIENNERQIKLLEEAAQRLYKEWFVDLRFPGYEDVEIVDGVPEGWENVPLRNMISFDIGGGWGEENIKEKSEKPAYVIRGTDLYGIIHGDMSSIPFRYHTASNRSSRILQDGDIVFEVSGGSKTEGVARTLLIRKEILESYDSPVICASFCKLVRVTDLSYSQYMYDTFQFLRSSGKTTEFDKKSASSIVNYRWKDFLAQQNVLVPPHSILDTYNGLAESLYYQIISHSKQIESLRNARDRLLPKLMSGEVEV